MGRWRARVFGSSAHIGLWTLPLFVAVGLLGAVLAGALASVYYGQKVEQLEQETARSRRQLAGAVREVDTTAEDALRAIREEVSSVRDELARRPPLADAGAAGLVVVRSSIVHTPAPPPPVAGPGGTPVPAPPPVASTEIRYASAVAVIYDAGTGWFVTTYEVVADPDDPGEAVRQVQVIVGGQTIDADVHSWQVERDLALLRADGIDQLRVADWRPPEEALTAGDRVFAAGLTSDGHLLQVGGAIILSDSDGIVTDAPMLDVLDGGALIDGDGRLVAIVSAEYTPFGSDIATMVPVRTLCERLIQCAAGDEAPVASPSPT